MVLKQILLLSYGNPSTYAPYSFWKQFLEYQFLKQVPILDLFEAVLCNNKFNKDFIYVEEK